ncbi:hypothetical protein HDU79_011689, partial [Rhizoclosmatium sp. JEL0117]
TKAKVSTEKGSMQSITQYFEKKARTPPPSPPPNQSTTGSSFTQSPATRIDDSNKLAKPTEAPKHAFELCEGRKDSWPDDLLLSDYFLQLSHC